MAQSPANTSNGARPESRFSSKVVPFSLVDGIIGDMGSVLRVKQNPTGLGNAVFSMALMLPGLLQDVAGTVSTLTGKKNVTLESLGAQAGALIEQFGHLPVEELARQAMSSITQTAWEAQEGNGFSRDPITPAVHLFAAEYVVANRGINDKHLFLKTLLESCALLSQSFPGKDAKGMLMARMLWETTEGIVAHSLEADIKRGMKATHTVEPPLWVLNTIVQDNSETLIPDLGVYVSTPTVPVFGVPKSDKQLRLANEILFANRNITTQKVFLEGLAPEAIVRSLMTGFEFVESTGYYLEQAMAELAAMKALESTDAVHLKKVAALEKRVKMDAEMHRLNMDAVMLAISPALFLEEISLADNGRGHSRALVNAEKYGNGGASDLTESDTAVTAYAKTGKFYPVADRMKGRTVVIPAGTKKSKHGGVEPSFFLKVMYDATAPLSDVRRAIGSMTKLADKMGPKNDKLGLATIPLSATLSELEMIHDSVTAKNNQLGTNSVNPKIKIINREQLPSMAEAMAKTTNLILGQVLAEIQTRAGKREEQVGNHPAVFADGDPAYTAKLVYRLGRLLEQNFVGNNLPAVGEVATGFNDFLIDVYTGRLEVTPEVEAATRMVFETSFSQYPRAIQVDFLKKLITRGITDPEKMNKWFEVLYPVAVREQNYIPALDEELYGVRPQQAKDILRITRSMVDLFPDLGDEPTTLMEHVLGGDETFIASALKLTWAVGNKLHAREIMVTEDLDVVRKPGTGKDQRRLLKDLNAHIDILRQMLIGRLEREFAYEMKAKSPLAMFGDLERVLGITEGFTAQITEVQNQFMHAFAATCALFQEDVLVVDSAENPQALLLQTIPRSAESADAIINLATGEVAQQKLKKMRALLENEEQTGELDLLLGRARTEVDGRGTLPEDILERAFTDAGARDTMLAEAAGDMLGKILGIPADSGDNSSKKEKTKKISPRLRSLFTLWNGGYGSYGKSIALMAILTANQQALGQGADSVARIIETLTQAESAGLRASVDLFERTGEIGLHKSITDIGKQLSLFTIGQVQNAAQADAIRGRVLVSVAEQAERSLARLAQIENQLTDLHAQNNELEIETYRQKIALRRQAIQANVVYAQRELATALNAIYQERAQLVQIMGGIRAAAVKSRLEVLQFLWDVYDPDGDYQTKRIALMKYIRRYTATDHYGIAMPDEGTILGLVGITEEEAKMLRERKGKKAL